MSVTDTSAAALLLTNRIVDVGVKPLTTGEFWRLRRTVGDLGRLSGVPAAVVAQCAGLTLEEADRLVALLGADLSFVAERERLRDQGVHLVSALDTGFPQRLRARLGDNCPSFLLVAGPLSFLEQSMVGVVGSRDPSPAAISVAMEMARTASSAGRAVVSGLARGIDRAAMVTALGCGAPVVGVPTEGVLTVLRDSDTRARVDAGELCVASPYAPGSHFSAGAAMGRNKIVYGLADVTLVVCSDHGKGGTWEGAREAMRRGFGSVAVWTGEGEGSGNAALVRQGGRPVTTAVAVLDAVSSDEVRSPFQGELFGGDETA